MIGVDPGIIVGFHSWRAVAEVNLCSIGVCPCARTVRFDVVGQATKDFDRLIERLVGK
jgi:hypothetical protein